MPDEILLNEAAYAVWQTVKEKGPIELGKVVEHTGIDQSQVAATATEATKDGFIDIDEREIEELVVAIGAMECFATLPERQAARHLHSVGGELPMAAFVDWAKAAGVAVNEVFKWGGARGWIERVKHDGAAKIVLTDEGRRAADVDFRDVDQVVVSLAAKTGKYPFDLLAADIDKERLRTLAHNRPEIAKIKSRTERTLHLTEKGRKALAVGQVRVVKERNTLTPEDLESDAWREIKLRPYDVTLAARDVYPAKIHPLRKIIEQTRRAFLEMGFAEVVSPMVESAFWNFDALFQPQDHPAREMQDTFYMRHPAEVPLPGEHSPAVSAGSERNTSGNRSSSQSGSKSSGPSLEGSAMSALVDHVRRTHEDGWETGSEGWGYKWSPERSRQVVLRTHTTAATIRALAANPNPPGKFFCVGWTYRNETISFKHLPVFHQVDGIIIDEEANLASLMGTLQEFYSKMGFGRVKFKPAFYPYTEPSVDVVVYMESRGKWLEMGGAGIFRPEVTLPLGCKQPVLAWGLGIERLAMLRFGLSDIRELYRPSLDALEGVPLCR
jgi:phenylalanyl-tRNA synthetase alpha chain